MTQARFRMIPIGVLFFCWLSANQLLADDPINAMPTPEESIKVKVAKLTAAEREAIELPDDTNQVVFQLTLKRDADQADVASPEPWLRVYADGRIDATTTNLIPKNPHQRSDRLTEDELVWLLHLIINRCEALERSTADILEAYAKIRDQPADDAEDRRSFHYHVHLADQMNTFAIPERVLITRPVRARMKLAIFASLHRYVSYLVAKAFLGEPAEREEIVRQLNKKLKKDHPNIPLFGMEHIAGAIRTDALSLSAVFMQEIELGDNRYQRVIAQISRKEDEDDLNIVIRIMDFSKYRPRR